MADKSTNTGLRREIVLKMRRRPNRIVLQCAVRIASTYRGRLRGFFSEDEELLALAGLPFAREVSSTGGLRSLTPEVVRAEMTAARNATRRDFELLAGGPGFEAILEAAAPDPREITGFLAYGEPLERPATRDVRDMLDEIASQRAASGILVTGKSAVRSSGPVIALLERGCDVAAVVDIAQQIASFDNQVVDLVILGQTAAEKAALLQAAQEALHPETSTSRHAVEMIEPRSFGYLANTRKAGLAVAWARGTVGGESISLFACQLECPLLLIP